MTISVAQTRPIRGDRQRNVANHLALIERAAAAGADAIFFPELSITGYEPELASALATTPDDSGFDVFQQLSDRHHILIGAGMPIRHEAGIQIGMLLFRPGSPRQCYSKQHLHPDEYPYFMPGHEPGILTDNGVILALAICYELSIPEHSLYAHQQGATVYVASVAKTAEGVEKAAQILSGIAKTYGMTVLMANCAGPCDTFVSAGKTAIWSGDGTLISQLDEFEEGLLYVEV